MLRQNWKRFLNDTRWPGNSKLWRPVLQESETKTGKLFHLKSNLHVSWSANLLLIFNMGWRTCSGSTFKEGHNRMWLSLFFLAFVLRYGSVPGTFFMFHEHVKNTAPLVLHVLIELTNSRGAAPRNCQDVPDNKHLLAPETINICACVWSVWGRHLKKGVAHCL